MINEPRSVTIDSLPFAVVREELSDQQVFGARFGAGSQADSDLTMYSTLSFEAGSDGSFTPYDGSKLVPYLVDGLVEDQPKQLKENDNLEIDSSATSGTYTSSAAHASYQWQDTTLFSCRDNTRNSLLSMTLSGEDLVKTALFLPSSILNANGPITSFAEMDGVCYMVTNGTTSTWGYLNGLTGTVVGTAPSGNFKQIFNLNDRMFAIGQTDTIYEITGNTTTLVKTKITDINYLAGTDQQTYNIDVLNGVAYIGQATGLWAFDGVRAYQVINESQSQNKLNYRFLKAYAGYLYFNRKHSMYRFNGASVERLFDFPTGTEFLDAKAAPDGLYVLTRPFYSDEIAKAKYGPDGYDTTGLVSDIYTYGYRMWKYDGINCYMFADNTNVTGSYGIVPLNDFTKLFTHSDLNSGHLWVGAWLNAGTGGSGNRLWHSYQVTGVGNYGNSIADRTQSIVFNFTDAGLSSVDKRWYGAKVDFANDISVNTTDELALYARTNETQEWALFVDFGTTNTDVYRANVPDLKAGSWLNEDKLQFKLVLNKKDISFRRLTVFYMPNPPYKRQWNLILNPASNTIENGAAFLATYRSKLETLRNNSVPFDFIDLDGVTYTAIVDSFSAQVLPTYAPDAAVNTEMQFTVVLREA